MLCTSGQKDPILKEFTSRLSASPGRATSLSHLARKGVGNLLRKKSHSSPIFTRKRTMRAAENCVWGNMYDIAHQIKDVSKSKIFTFN